MRSDVAHSALGVDMVLQAADQAEMTNLHYPTKTTGSRQCPNYCGYPYEGSDTGSQDDIDIDGAGCNTAGSQSEPRTTLATILGLAGLGAVGVRRRRTKRARRAQRNPVP
jgi:MYXO-CTERM domain-containing protein